MKPKLYRCLTCNAITRLPDVPVRNTGYLRCPNGHLFSYKIVELRAQWWKLGTKALRAMASSPRQKEIKAQQSAIEARLNQLGVTRTQIVDAAFSQP